MGISVSIFEGAVPRFPLEIKLSLSCDGDEHRRTDLLPIVSPGVHVFQHSDGFIGAYARAMSWGWKETHHPERGRLFLGPCCSRKKA